MAASVTSKTVVVVPAVVTRHTMSSLTAGLQETVSHLGPSGVTPDTVEFVLTTAPYSMLPVSLVWDSTSTSANTVTVRLISDGSLDGAAGTLLCTFYSQATGGLTAPF